MATDNKLDLSGDGAAYIRVSDDDQNTKRQQASINNFLKVHKATIRTEYWFIDEGWARDTAERRPDFQRMMKLAQGGHIRWIVVNKLDRYGWKSWKQLVYYLYLLEEAGCHLYDVDGKDWTSGDISTEVQLLFEGKNSVEEPRKISHRVLGGMAEQARNGEWQGGPPRLGFDIGCFARAEPDNELWRVVIQGRNLRLKVYPDGATERFDGKRNFPNHQEDYEMLRLVPSRDKSKIKAAVSVFKRYAHESISFSALARYLSDDLGYPTCYGLPFDSRSIIGMLTDPTYLGYPAWNKVTKGKFHRYRKNRVEAHLNLDRKQSRNDEADHIRSSRRLFTPLVELELWNLVQNKLRQRPERATPPISHLHYLRGLLYCAGCGQKMVAAHKTGDDCEYHCGTYFKATKAKKTGSCRCRRNGVWQQAEIQPYIDRYLEESKTRLDIFLHKSDSDDLTDRLKEQEADTWQGFLDGVQRLQSYLVKYHPQEYAAIAAEDQRRWEEDRRGDEARTRAKAEGRSTKLPPGSLKAQYGQELADACNEAIQHLDDPPAAADSNDFVAALLQSYRANFDPEVVIADIARLEKEEDELMRQWRDLPTERTKAKAKERLKELEAQINDLKTQQQDAAAVVEGHYREMRTLQQAVVNAQLAGKSGRDERSMRQLGEALRQVIRRISCRFASTGVKGGGFRRKGTKLVEITVEPVLGQMVQYQTESGVTSGPDGSRTLLPQESGLP